MFFEVRTKRLTVTERNAYKTVKELWLLRLKLIPKPKPE